MKLRDSLYHIISKESVAPIHYDIELDATHVIYQAHFPGEPITPGVCVIQIAKELLEDHLSESLVVRSVKNVKFLRVISPLDTPQVTYIFDKITYDETGDTVKVITLVETNNIQLAKISFTCSRP